MAATRQREITITGMHCDHCVDAVRESLEGIEGLTVHEVDIGTANVSYDRAQVSDDQVAAALEEAGYEVEA